MKVTEISIAYVIGFMVNSAYCEYRDHVVAADSTLRSLYLLLNVCGVCHGNKLAVSPCNNLSSGCALHLTCNDEMQPHSVAVVPRWGPAGVSPHQHIK
jgi:hypothetical protein